MRARATCVNSPLVQSWSVGIAIPGLAWLDRALTQNFSMRGMRMAVTGAAVLNGVDVIRISINRLYVRDDLWSRVGWGGVGWGGVGLGWGW